MRRSRGPRQAASEPKDGTRVPAPRGTWIGGTAVIVVVALQIAGLFWFWRTERPRTAAAEGHADVIEVAVGRPSAPADIKGKLSVEVIPGRVTPSPGYDGTVTSVYVSRGSAVSSGTRLFALNGIDRYGYHGDRPFYRVLREGDSGDDVVALRRLLNDVGMGPVSERRSTFDYMVAAAVTKWSKALGLSRPPVTTAALAPTPAQVMNNGSPSSTRSATATTTQTAATAPAVPTAPGSVTSIGAVFDPQWTVWLPSASASIAKSDVRVGIALPAAGTPMYTSARSLGRVTLSSEAAIPRLDVPVRRSLQVGDTDVPIVDDRVQVGPTNARALIAAALAVDPEPTKPVVVDGVIKSHVRTDSVSVPVTAVYDSPRADSCVAVKNGGRYVGRAVTVVASNAASGQATVEGLSAGTILVANPSDSGNEPAC